MLIDVHQSKQTREWWAKWFAKIICTFCSQVYTTTDIGIQLHYALT